MHASSEVACFSTRSAIHRTAGFTQYCDELRFEKEKVKTILQRAGDRARDESAFWLRRPTQRATLQESSC